jgi:hypothetical protein
LVECIVDQAARFGVEFSRSPLQVTHEKAGAMGAVDVARLAGMR